MSDSVDVGWSDISFSIFDNYAYNNGGRFIELTNKKLDKGDIWLNVQK